jgi:hypothetical protein
MSPRIFARLALPRGKSEFPPFLCLASPSYPRSRPTRTPRIPQLAARYRSSPSHVFDMLPCPETPISSRLLCQPILPFPKETSGPISSLDKSSLTSHPLQAGRPAASEHGSAITKPNVSLPHLYPLRKLTSPRKTTFSMRPRDCTIDRTFHGRYESQVSWSMFGSTPTSFSVSLRRKRVKQTGLFAPGKV